MKACSIRNFLPTLCAAMLVLLIGCGRAPEYVPLPPGSTVLALGDSVTYGTGARDGEDYPARLAELGGNDFLRRQPAVAVKENIRVILRRVKAANIPVVLVAVPAFSPLGAVVGRLPDAPLYAELAEEEQVPLVPDVFADVLSDPDLKADPIHPNAAGYRKLAEGIADGLRDAGLLARR